MACFNVDAEVLALRSQAINEVPGANPKGTSFPTPPKSQDAIQSLETLHALFAAVGTPRHGEERLQKRRKIEAKSDYDTQPAHVQEDRSVVLAKVSINLVRLHIITTTKYARLTGL